MHKRNAPSHVKKPTFIHPEAESPFIAILEKVPDPRGASPNCNYSLTSVAPASI